MSNSLRVQSFHVVLVLFLLTACQQRASGPAVQAVYPTTEQVPENLLRMYVTFATPMKTVGTLEKIKLLDDQGNEVKNVFFNNVYELWNHEQTQLTILVDPARVKQGLQANEVYGRALQPNRTYTLVIEAGIEDVQHRPLQQPYTKVLHVVPADLQAPNLDLWQYALPKANSKQALVITFPHMLDYHSLKHRLAIADANNQQVQGTVAIGKAETEWAFWPMQPWAGGSYTLYVNTRLEDPAGNNLNGLFDHKAGTLKYPQEGTILSVPITIQ